MWYIARKISPQVGFNAKHILVSVQVDGESWVFTFFYMKVFGILHFSEGSKLAQNFDQCPGYGVS